MNLDNYLPPKEVETGCVKCKDPECGTCKVCMKNIVCGYYCIGCFLNDDDIPVDALNGWMHKDVWHGM